MNFYRSWLLFLVFFSFCLSLGAFEPYETPDGKVILVDFSKKDLWETSGIPSVNLDEKTPTGEVAITYETEEEKKSVLRIKKYDGGGEWRNKKFKFISFWVKGDGSGSYVQLRLLTDDGEFQHQFYLTGTNWEYKKLTWDKFTNKEGKNLDISKIKMLIFRSTKKFKISIGPLKLEPGDETSISFPLLEIPSALVFFTEKPPIIDGKLDEKCWEMAPEYELSYNINSDTPPKEKTKFRLLYDENNLYFSAVLECKDTSNLKTTRKEDRNDIYLDDCLELFINGNKDMQTYTHFMVNSEGYKGTIKRYYDKVKDDVITDTKYTGKLEVKCKIVKPEKWYIEGSIPLVELDLKKNYMVKVFFFK